MNQIELFSNFSSLLYIDCLETQFQQLPKECEQQLLDGPKWGCSTADQRMERATLTFISPAKNIFAQQECIKGERREMKTQIKMSNTKSPFESHFKSNSFFNTGSFYVQPLNLEATDCGSFIIAKPKGLKLKQVKLSQHYLICSSKIIDLENVYFEEAHHLHISEPGIRIFKGQNNLQLYGESAELNSALLKYGIQTNFSEKYKILAKLGYGHTSQVVRIRCKSSKTELACKFFPKNLYSADLDQQALHKEISILRRLNHPSLVALREVFETNNHIGLVFDCFEGGELQIGKYKEIDAIRLLKPLVEGVAYLHEQGIFHRDIKPSNVLLREKNNLDTACLVDFGLADHWNEHSDYLFHRCGTPGFVAPEVLHDAKYTTQVDVYSLGVLLFTLLTGQNPFDSTDYDTVVIQNYYGQVDFHLLKVSPAMMDLLQRMLHLDPEARITAKQILKHSIFAAQPQPKPFVMKQMKVAKLNIVNHYQLGGVELTKCSSLNTLSSCSGSPKSPFSNSSLLSDELKSPSPLLPKLKGQTTCRKSKFQQRCE